MIRAHSAGSPQFDRNQSIARAAKRALEQSAYRSLQGIDCEYSEGQLILRGTVPSYYMKQVAQSLLKPISSIQRVDNRLLVASEPPRMQ